MNDNLNEQFYNKVKQCIALRPNCTKIEISAYAHVPIDIIENFIENGKLEEREGELRIAKKKKMPEETRKKAINGLAEKYRAEVEHVVVDTRYSHRSASKLIKDIEAKYGYHDSEDEWVR